MSKPADSKLLKSLEELIVSSLPSRCMSGTTDWIAKNASLVDHRARPSSP